MRKIEKITELLENVHKDKKGQMQVATNFFTGIAGFVIGVIIVLLIVGTLVGGGFFTSTSLEQGALNNLSSNVTSGVNTIGSKLPTIFTVIAIVIILAVIALLWVVWSRMRIGTGGGGGAFG